MVASATLCSSSPYAPFKVADWMRPRSQGPAPNQCPPVAAPAPAGCAAPPFGHSDRWTCWVQGDLFASGPVQGLTLAEA